MTDNIQTQTVAEKLESALSKSTKLILAVAVFFVIAFISVVICSVVNNKAVESGIEQVDSLTYALLKDAENLEGKDLEARQTEALEKLSALSAKSGIVGVRANMLIADIKFATKSFEEAKNAYVKAAESKKSAYTYGLNYFNAGVCAEELNDMDSAVKYYEAASKDTEFIMIDHALFSLGRCYETKESYAEAKSTYEKLNALHPSSSYGQLAKSRLISLKAEGKIQ